MKRAMFKRLDALEARQVTALRLEEQRSERLEASRAGLMPTSAHAASVSRRLRPRRGRSSATEAPVAGSLHGAHSAMAPIPRSPVPRTRRSRTVSAWSSMVWPRTMAPAPRRWATSAMKP